MDGLALSTRRKCLVWTYRRPQANMEAPRRPLRMEPRLSKVSCSMLAWKKVPPKWSKPKKRVKSETIPRRPREPPIQTAKINTRRCTDFIFAPFCDCMAILGGPSRLDTGPELYMGDRPRPPSGVPSGTRPPLYKHGQPQIPLR